MGKAGTKKSPVKKAEKGPEKPVKRLGTETKPTVAVRKSTRNAPGTSKQAPEEIKAVKVNTGSKGKASKKKKVDEEAPEAVDHSATTNVTEDAGSKPEEAQPEPEEAPPGSSSKSGKAKGTRAKVSKVTVEHCKSWQVFKRKALENVDVIKSSVFASEDDFESELVVGKKGSFEITVTLDDGNEVVVWSGINRGPPRKNKFPDAEALLDEINKATGTET